jgi:sRNA-binding protein
MLRVGRAAGEETLNGEVVMAGQKMLDIAARIAEIERKAQDAEARAAAAEARAAEAEKRAAEAEAGKPKPKAGFVELKPNERYEYAKGVEMLPNGKTVEIVVNKEGYAEFTYNKRFWKDA